ncbi:MAG: hypothetical protein ACYTDX_09445 [Planctomycetota bacterium]|jgi:hypothetical protein
MTIYRLLELIPLALVLGSVLGALRHRHMEAIQRAALRNTGKILAWLILGSFVLQGALLLVQD